jgi:hypothetical protein
MNLTDLERRLIETARRNPPGDGMPYAFEKRVMARLRDTPRIDFLAEWNRALWRAAVSCIAVMLLLSAWSMLPTDIAGSGGDDGLDLETTVMAAADPENLGEGAW